jgi:ribosome-associated toxin RatA of RatAB toxin-antitoxin module
VPHFQHSIEIQADREELFDLTQNYDLRLSWDPFLKEARLIGGSEAGVGAHAWCVAKNGLGMETEYVSFKRPEVTAIKMTKGPSVFRSFAGSWRFDESGPVSTRVTFRYNFSTRPGWLQPIVGPILRIVLSRENRKRLVALKKAVEGSRRAARNAKTAASFGPQQSG